MRSARPKVLHTLGGRHLLQHVLGAAVGLGATRTIVVTGHGAEEVEKSARAPGLVFVRQQPQLGRRQGAHAHRSGRQNGKLRAEIKVPVDAAEADVRAVAEADERVKAAMAGKTLRKFVFVPKRLVNFVVG